jgi:hypothetical protein
LNRAIVRKELRELLPFCVLSIVVGLSEIASLLSEQVDMRPLAVTFDAFDGGSTLVFWLLGFAIGTGLTTREQDDGTLAFLDGLPVTRSELFFTKYAVTLGVVLLAPIVQALSMIGLHLLSRGSLDHELRLELLLQSSGVQWLSVCIAVLLGAALGRLRSVTWLVTGVLACGLSLLVDRYPRAQALNPLALAETELTSAGLTIDTEAVCAQVALAAVALLVAWHGFVRAGKSRPPELSRGPVVGALLTLLTTCSLFAAVALWFEDSASDEDEVAGADSDEPRFASSPPAQTETAHYRISYPAIQAHRALALATSADAIFERVHALLGAPPGESIDVDASGSLRNTEGTAYFGRIRMQIDGDLEAVLAHETAHVVAQRLAGKDRDWLWREATVLDEGLATWVERHFGDAEQARESERLLLAALHTRRELIIEELANPARLAAVRDDHLKYPAGQAVIAAVVQLHGETALPRLLHAFGDDRLPNDLRGLSLWQTVFQRAGIDLGAVIDQLYREVTKNAAALAPQIAALPRPRVRLVSSHGWIGAQALLDGEHDAERLERVVLRFKPTPSSSFDTFDTVNVAPGEPAWRDLSQISGAQVCVQAGLALAAGNVLYKPWTCLPTRDADGWAPPDAGAGQPDAE